ncbi:MAG: efflux RND transporter periplasmic adaptor subunit [Chloroflexi bacterium]|nr:efflux RND transporter periplasmic adaptor subunit [Chloroflexota bacterium]
MTLKRPFWQILAVLIAGGAVAAWFATRGNSKTDLYITATVEKGDIEANVSAVGVLQPFEYVDVGTQVTGQLKTLHVDIGDQVKEKDLVAEIDPTLFVARVDQIKATLQTLQAQLVDRLAQQRFAEQQNARNKQLFTSDAVSEEALQQSAAQEEQAVAQVAALRAQIQQTQSQLIETEANLRYTKIYAPMTGTVVSCPARQGQTLVANQQAPIIMRIADLSTMTVWAQTSEADVPMISIGMPVYFNTLGQPERRWYGKVRQILPTPEILNNVILYNVLFDVDNSDLALKPQMSAQVYFVLAKAENALQVPVAALQPAKQAREKAAAGTKKPKEAKKAEGRTFTVRVLKDGELEQRTVMVGIQTRLFAQVLSGLSEGETVVVGTSTEKKQSDSKPLPGSVPPRH